MVLNERSSDVSRSIPLGAGSYDRTLAGVIGRLLALGTHAMSEACLFLNIWAPPPGRFSEALPVLVWIHGGSFTSGGSTQYTGDHFIQVRDDVVLVTLNYRYRTWRCIPRGLASDAAWHPTRHWHLMPCGIPWQPCDRLGALGFLGGTSVAATTDDGSSGNFGLQDTRSALRWVTRCRLRVACFMLRVARGRLHVVCCMSRVACCRLHPARCKAHGLTTRSAVATHG
jgi:hypothetical protein